jgi:hypothetical protein
MTWAKSNYCDSSDPINEAFFEPTVTLWLCEVRGNNFLFDVLIDREITANEAQPTFVDAESAVSISGVQQTILLDVNDAPKQLHAGVGRLLKSTKFEITLLRRTLWARFEYLSNITKKKRR